MEKPRSQDELIHRLAEITSVIGYTDDKQTLYCQMTDVDPRITVEVPVHIFERLPLSRKQAVLKNFKQLLQSFQREKEDVVAVTINVSYPVPTMTSSRRTHPC